MRSRRLSKKQRLTLPNDGDAARGLENRYTLKRLDGSLVGEWFFVLRESDPFTPTALRSYADACAGQFAPLAADLRRAADQLEAAAA